MGSPFGAEIGVQVAPWLSASSTITIKTGPGLGGQAKSPRPLGSLRPEAIGAAVEVTKPSEPSRQRAAWRSGDQAGRNVSERRAGLEKFNVGADPTLTRGRPPSLANSGNGWNRPSHERSKTQRSHRGNDNGMSGSVGALGSNPQGDPAQSPRHQSPPSFPSIDRTLSLPG